MWELQQAGQLDETCLTVTGRTIGRESRGPREPRPRGDPTVRRRRSRAKAGFLVLPRQSVRLRDHEDQRDLRGIPRALPEHPGPGGAVRGARDRVRRLRRLPRAHQRPRARHRRELHPGHPRLGAGRLARLGRGGEHAAARTRCCSAASPACRRSATAGSRARRTAPRSSTPRPKARWAAASRWLRTGDTIRIDLAAGTCDMLVERGRDRAPQARPASLRSRRA